MYPETLVFKSNITDTANSQLIMLMRQVFQQDISIIVSERLMKFN